MDLNGTIIIYNEDTDTTTVQTNETKAIDKVLNKYPKDSITIVEEDKKHRPVEVKATVQGRHVNISKYKTKEDITKQLRNLKNQ